MSLVVPASAPFAPPEIAALNQALARSTGEQRQWLAGFLAGYAAALSLPAGQQPAAPAQPSTRAAAPLTILYGTESGNSEALAGEIAALAKKNGFKPKLVDMGDVGPAELAKATNLLVVTATWGEGDPPQRAAAFYRDLLAEGAPRLPELRYSVLALGDRAYVNFCETGRRIDERLAELGGKRIAERVDCDLDYKAAAQGWMRRALEKLGDDGEGPGAEIIHVDFHGPSATANLADGPQHAEILERIELNGTGSAKSTWHLELSLEGTGLTYEPGDSLAVSPRNDPALAEEIARLTGNGGDGGLVTKLIGERDVTTLSRAAIASWNEIAPQKGLAELLAGDAWRAYVADRQLVDLLQDFPATVPAATLEGFLRPLPARSYSIASSPLAHEGEAHFLVAAVRWASHGRQRMGVASTFMAERVAKGQTLEVSLKPNRHFRLPTDGDVPVVMIGPGTGVAPFRAFLHHRQALGAKGRNWLIFGDQHYTTDFLYQLEWQQMQKDGVLSRIDVAFSRDQPHKIYVQDRLWQQRVRLWLWLQDGAQLYLCGDAKAMAKDVETTLRRIAMDQGGITAETAQAWQDDLVRTKRFQRDVY